MVATTAWAVSAIQWTGLHARGLSFTDEDEAKRRALWSLCQFIDLAADFGGLVNIDAPVDLSPVESTPTQNLCFWTWLTEGRPRREAGLN